MATEAAAEPKLNVAPVPNLRDYVRRHFPEEVMVRLRKESHRMPPGYLDHLEAQFAREELERLRHFREGDVWQEWSFLVHGLAGSGGLRLVRGGEVVKTWVDWVA